MNEYTIWLFDKETDEHYCEFINTDSFTEAAKYAEDTWVTETIRITSIEG